MWPKCRMVKITSIVQLSFCQAQPHQNQMREKKTQERNDKEPIGTHPHPHPHTQAHVPVLFLSRIDYIVILLIVVAFNHLF